MPDDRRQLLGQTPSQTVGPYFSYGLAPAQYGYRQMPSLADGRIAGDGVEGERIRLDGRVFDGAGNPVNDALIEIWQADARGRYAHPADPSGSNAAFRGFGRFGTGTDPDLRFVFETIMPGAPDRIGAPHINMIVFMRGLISHLYTRVYFEDLADANAGDPVLLAVPAARRSTLIAKRTAGAHRAYRFDIHMQGPNETVFFDV